MPNLKKASETRMKIKQRKKNNSIKENIRKKDMKKYKYQTIACKFWKTLMKQDLNKIKRK